jgi:subtilisin family serine protease
MAPLEHVSALRGIVDIDQLQDAFRTGRGKGVRVCVIDSGVDGSHPDLAGKIRAQHDVVSDRSGTRCIAAPPTDSIGHGTACAGIILQVAAEAEIYSVQVIGRESKGTGDQLMAGLAFALDQRYDIINMSLGTTDDRIARRLGALADRAFYEGRIIVAAANNFGQVAFPAYFSSVLSVNMEGFENPETLRYDWGKTIELSARGIYVEAPAMGGGKQLFTGTSFACPHVTGLLARLLSVYPGLAAFEARFLLSLLSTGEEAK